MREPSSALSIIMALTERRDIPGAMIAVLWIVQGIEFVEFESLYWESCSKWSRIQKYGLGYEVTTLLYYHVPTPP